MSAPNLRLLKELDAQLAKESPPTGIPQAELIPNAPGEHTDRRRRGRLITA